MTNLQKDILEDFIEAQGKSGYKRPKNLSEMERESNDDDVFDIGEAHCPVDRFIKKNRGWK
jgi:hypothetical protein